MHTKQIKYYYLSNVITIVVVVIIIMMSPPPHFEPILTPIATLMNRVGKSTQAAREKG